MERSSRMIFDGLCHECEATIWSIRQRKTKLALQAPAHKVANAGGDSEEIGGLRRVGVFDIAERVEALELPGRGGKTEREVAALLVGHAIDGIGAVDQFLSNPPRGVRLRRASQLAQCAYRFRGQGSTRGDGEPGAQCFELWFASAGRKFQKARDFAVTDGLGNGRSAGIFAANEEIDAL